MYLKRLTINGFKSFAAKTVLELGPGIVAVVGPNGSGKSNIADAIRWSLGEQSAKQLRSKKSEELVFAGTEKKAKGSMAQVDLLMDNSDGGMAIDFSEVELSRLLYRSGESEYKLNGRKVKLSEVQQLLAQSGFGQNSYAVIGQGMIDGFILATPAERKLLFDEASGIRQYELKREAALRKLDATEQNLVRVRDILGELEPRLKILERSVAAAQEHYALAEQLAELRAAYVASATQQYGDEKAHFQKRHIELTDVLAEAKKELEELSVKRNDIETQRAQYQQQQQILTQNLHKAEAERDHIAGELSVKKAELQFQSAQADPTLLSDRAALLSKELNSLEKKYQQLSDQLVAARAEEANSTKQLEVITEKINEAQGELNKLRRQTDTTSRPEYIAQALAILKQVSYGLANQHDNEQLRLLVYKAGRLLSHASVGQEETIEGIKRLQQQLNKLMTERESVHEPYTKAVIQVRSLELDVDYINAQIKTMRNELSSAEAALNQVTQGKTVESREAEIHELESQMAEVTAQIADLRTQLTNESADSADMFELAQSLEATRTKVVSITSELKETETNMHATALQLTEIQAKARAWQVSGGSATARPLDEQERALMLLEGKLAGSADRDPDVLEEYTESKKRFDFMTEQVADLERAGKDLVTVIGQLEELIRVKFQESFADIAQHFTVYFEQLFGGGKASLAFKPDANGVYGIEIKAVPPGKRVESLATLSGGERSMTGIALLAAILTVNPSPFVVLDEVDAALDEANSGRLAKILHQIAKKSQLIIITHNRQVMAAADVIFGVTMDAHHVSRLLSIKLEQARELAAA